MACSSGPVYHEEGVISRKIRPGEPGGCGAGAVTARCHPYSFAYQPAVGSLHFVEPNGVSAQSLGPRFSIRPEAFSFVLTHARRYSSSVLLPFAALCTTLTCSASRAQARATYVRSSEFVSGPRRSANACKAGSRSALMGGRSCTERRFPRALAPCQFERNLLQDPVRGARASASRPAI